MTLAEYVDRVMREKELSAYEVEKRSGRQIVDSYVVMIRSGRSKHPSVPKLKGLAKGLGIDYRVLVEIAAGSEPQRTSARAKWATEGWTPESLANAITKMVRNETLGRAVQLLLTKNDEELKTLITRLKRTTK